MNESSNNMEAESGSGASGSCSEELGNCTPDQGQTLLIIVIAGAVFLIVLAVCIICCMTGVGRYLRRRKRQLMYDLNNGDGYLFDKSTGVQCTKVEFQSRCRSSTPATTSEISSPNTVTSEFSYASSGANSTAPPSPPPVTLSAPEKLTATSSPCTDSLVPAYINESEQSPVLLPVKSSPKRKRPRDNYDRLIGLSTASGTTVMTFHNETASVTEDAVVIENTHNDEGGNCEEEIESIERELGLLQKTVPAASVRRHQSERVVTDNSVVNTNTHHDLSHTTSLPLNTIVSLASSATALNTNSTPSRRPEPDYAEISDDTAKQDCSSPIYAHIDDTVTTKNPKATGKQAAKIAFGQGYSYAAKHVLHSPKHNTEQGNGVFVESTPNANLDHPPPQVAEETHTLQKRAANSQDVNSYLLILPDTDMSRSHSTPDVPAACSLTPHHDEPSDDTIVARDHTYSNLPKEYEVSVSISADDRLPTVSELADSRPPIAAPGLKKSKTLPPSLPPVIRPKPAAAAREPFYTSLIRREVQDHDYDNPSPSAQARSLQHKSRPKPRLARQPKQIISGNSSCLDYTNISVWLSSEKKTPQSMTSGQSSTLPAGYTPLLRSTMAKNSDYDYALP